MTDVIEVKNLGKKYIVSHDKEAIVRHLPLLRFLSIKNYEQFWALKDIDLTLEQGQSLAILGRNGAGKTTLLNILAGITVPTVGSVKVKGKVSALLSLGAGFHPELTGEENIFLNASILGLKTKEIRRKLNQIIEFSELGSFISAPLKIYSTGMYMRLGFAIAINVDFDILLIDEILSVGDVIFQNKCLEKLEEFRSLGKSIVIVSQSLNLLERFCDRAIILEKGKVEFSGELRDAISVYSKKCHKQPNSLIVIPHKDNIETENYYYRYSLRW